MLRESEKEIARITLEVRPLEPSLTLRELYTDDSFSIFLTRRTTSLWRAIRRRLTLSWKNTGSCALTAVRPVPFLRFRRSC